MQQDEESFFDLLIQETQPSDDTPLNFKQIEDQKDNINGVINEFTFDALAS